MLSYAANHEDVRLARVLTSARGTYVDVGANHPSEGSVTKHFYDRGWRGMNVEPSPAMFARLEAERPEDINVHGAAWDAEGRGTLHFFPRAPGLSTLDATIAAQHELGLTFETHDVPLFTLAGLCETHLEGRGIDLMVVDVEGAEARVLAGADFRRWRPRIVVVEATKPLSRTRSHDAWEPILTGADYIPTAFDGCNRFYVAAEEAALAPALAEPLCFVDRYVDAEAVRAIAAAATKLLAIPPEERSNALEAIASGDPEATLHALLKLDAATPWLRRGAG
ncbi:MAG: FkbM family methyltransferase [Deltaproteobacteria bacterium]